MKVLLTIIIILYFLYPVLSFVITSVGLSFNRTCAVFEPSLFDVVVALRG
jgi:hypothetical protein